ncbi:MAG: hypothetical protein HOP23_10355 [Methylococcaceae bacterium]|nr:hypothetical protein [Methylococcaceae bacterium]
MPGALGKSAARADVYRVTCPSGTRKLDAFVRDDAPVNQPLLNVQIQAARPAGSFSSGMSTDKVRDGDTLYSTTVARLARNTGVYTITVSKSAPIGACNSNDDDEHDDENCNSSAVGAEKYSLKYACRDINNNILRLSVPTTQPQNQ